MVFFIIRLLLIKAKKKKIALLALLLCYAIECFQLYQAEWIIEIRKTVLGRYVLGQGFLWSDL
jgi:glycopeptide antibiotics resistance protein